MISDGGTITADETISPRPFCDQRLRSPARRSGGGAPGGGAHPGAARGDPPLSRSARLRGTRGRGMATPMGPAPRVTGDESGDSCCATGRGAVGAAGFQFFRIPGFHPPRPAPAAGRRPGHGQLQQLET